MRVIVLTSQLQGFASHCIPVLMSKNNIKIAMIVINDNKTSSKHAWYKNKLRKITKIGIIGAVNGIRMRKWYSKDINSYIDIKNLYDISDTLNLTIKSTPEINCRETIDLFKEANADLGLSLGNSYINSEVFSIPKYGMINAHHELLPEFQCAQSIIWQIYEGSLKTGYTIHQIDSGIDTGNIIYKEDMQIEVKPTLGETVSHNYARLFKASADKLADIVDNYDKFSVNTKAQKSGRLFTTPTFKQYCKMIKQHKRLYQKMLNNHDKRMRRDEN